MTVSACRGALRMRGTGIEGTFDRMTDGHTTDPADTGPAEKNPAHWTTGDEPITGPQRSHLETLLQQAGAAAPAARSRRPVGPAHGEFAPWTEPDAVPRGTLVAPCASRVPLGAFPRLCGAHRAAEAPVSDKPIMHVMTI